MNDQKKTTRFIFRELLWGVAGFGPLIFSLLIFRMVSPYGRVVRDLAYINLLVFAVIRLLSFAAPRKIRWCSFLLAAVISLSITVVAYRHTHHEILRQHFQDYANAALPDSIRVLGGSFDGWLDTSFDIHFAMKPSDEKALLKGRSYSQLARPDSRGVLGQHHKDAVSELGEPTLYYWNDTRPQENDAPAHEAAFWINASRTEGIFRYSGQ